MDITELPFVKKVGIKELDGGTLSLEMESSVTNHLGTIHASAQFTLAETASGKLLIDAFPEFDGNVIPVLRDSKIKFKRPAETSITANASITEECAVSLKAQLERRGRGTIEIAVDVKDSGGKTTCVGSFNWYIQSIA